MSDEIKNKYYFWLYPMKKMKGEAEAMRRNKNFDYPEYFYW